jgi:tartrate-resistant acid phosphatase type 5
VPRCVQLDARLTQRDKRWHCERSFTVPAAGGRAEIFFIDTTPIVDDYQHVSWAKNRGGAAEETR